MVKSCELTVGHLFEVKAHSRSLGCPGRPIRGFESEQRVRFSVKKIACGLVAATDLYGPSGFVRDDKVRVCASIQCGADGWVEPMQKLIWTSVAENSPGRQSWVDIYDSISPARDG